jgi:hypothetical protein
MSADISALPAWLLRSITCCAQTPAVTSAYRFTYEEEQDAEAFFVPLVWSMIVADTALPWRHAAIVLFTPAPASEGGARTESTSSVFDPHELRSLQSLSVDDVPPVARATEEVQAV